jgi:hypothetical protein
MNPVFALSWLERWAVRILHRSPRISMLVVKGPGDPDVCWSVAREDEVAISLMEAMLGVDELEPPSMLLERLYHLPAYGEDE